MCNLHTYYTQPSYILYATFINTYKSDVYTYGRDRSFTVHYVVPAGSPHSLRLSNFSPNRIGLYIGAVYFLGALSPLLIKQHTKLIKGTDTIIATKLLHFTIKYIL